MSLKKEDLLHLVFPPRCPVCDKVIETGQVICQQCHEKIVHIAEPVCKKCGKPFEDERREYCADCTGKKHFFVQGKAVFSYQGGIRSSMYRFKYQNRREYGTYYAKEAVYLHGEWIKCKKIDLIIPVPMYYWKERRRGYNQAAVFARALSKECGIPAEYQMVQRIRNTVPQKELNDVERKKNLKHAFQLKKGTPENKNILLVDDIYTTGSTMDEVAEVLLGAGAKNIYFLCISIGEGY